MILMISKTTARKMYYFYTERIDQLIQAQTSLTSGGVKSYKIGDMEITKFDMDKLSGMLEEAVEKQAYYEALMRGKATRKTVGIVPTDL